MKPHIQDIGIFADGFLFCQFRIVANFNLLNQSLQGDPTVL